jgi:hypothetical protein
LQRDRVLRAIALLVRDFNMRIPRDQCVHQIHAPLRSIHIDVRNLMRTRASGKQTRAWNFCRRPQPDDPHSLLHRAEFRKARRNQIDMQRLSIGLQQNRPKHLPRIRISFGAGNSAVSVCIDPADDLGSHRDPWRQIDLQTHPIRFERNSRGLQILIQSMSACQRQRCQTRAPNQQSARLHCLASFAP